MKKVRNAAKKAAKKQTHGFDMQNFEINNMIISNTIALANLARDYRMQIEIIFAS